KKIKLWGGPEQIAFSPNGSTAYVTSAIGLYVISVKHHHQISLVRHLGDPHGVLVSADGSKIYVTNTVAGQVDVISAATDRVIGRIQVGQLPWQIISSSDGSTLYVANPDSNSVSVINA